MECYKDTEVFHALLKKVEDWARDKGMGKIVGPLGFSDKDPQGFQIEGFEYPRLFTAATNSSYMPEMIEDLGYTKEVDLVNYLIPIPSELPPLYLKAYDRIIKSKKFNLIEFNSKKQLKPYIIPVLELMNDTFTDIYGFVPLTMPKKKTLQKDTCRFSIRSILNLQKFMAFWLALLLLFLISLLALFLQKADCFPLVSLK
jgi:hypothetical protein